MTSRTVAAIDLGAESGRVATVTYDGARLELDIVHRFVHAPVLDGDLLRWDLQTLWSQIQAGLQMLDARDVAISAVGVDAWGVDYGLLDARGALVDVPTCYRDSRSVRAMHRAIAAVGMDGLYDSTGVQVIPINTLFSLMSDVTEHPGRLAAAERLLMLPDVFHHLLSGSTVTEYTAASTSGALDMTSGAWATQLLDRLDIPTRLLPEVAMPGTDVGPLLGGYRGSLRDCRVVLPPAHDTASAVVGVPRPDAGDMFISSGTWSLVGVETEQAYVTAESRRANLTNEGGYAGTIRLLSNVMGLWILQNCRRQWLSEGVDLSYAEIARLAGDEPGLLSLINPDAGDFLPPGDMPRRIQDYCARVGMPVPRTVGAIARCVIDSLALSYREVRESITAVTGQAPRTINIVGGGSSHVLLSQLTADAAGVPVRCGPVEATALGNAAVQLAALGELGDLAHIRRVIAASSDVNEYHPHARHDWDTAAERFATLRRDDQARDRSTGAPTTVGT
jgi:rhamnulokinase